MSSEREPQEAERIERIAREAYERCHPDDTFDDLKRRAAFSREDQGLLRDWLEFAARQAADRRK
ncbi:hypothetical protein [Mesorhizobium sp. KR1-2]|uniref:hypothetical protein n=1 Tax=Mesorhizobium sp. KR1-2 TaxID=3156609 RepID=UPI0032B4498C